MAYIGKYLFCVVVSAVLYCVQCSLRCTPTRYPIRGLSTARWEAVVVVVAVAAAAAAAGDGCYCVIVHSVS